MERGPATTELSGKAARGSGERRHLRSASSDASYQKSSFSTIPRAPRVFIPRPRLDAELDVAVRKPLTVLVAPAGSGKTAALARWASRARDHVRWMVAQRGESPSRLAAALLAGVDSVPAGGPGPVASEGGTDSVTLPVADPDGDAASVTAVTQRLQAADVEPGVLVVDDAHELETSSWRLLDAAVTQAPDRVRIVLATRRDTPLPTVNLELSESLTVLRADALRFDDDEARQLVAAHAPDATRDDIAALQSRAHGWAAALVLGARSLAGSPDRVAARAALTRTDQPVLDYLLGEVFDTMAASSRHVLLCTADELTVTGSVAVLLSGDPDAAIHLGELAGDGMLVTAYDTGPEVAWAYHPLLRELLRRRVAVDGPDHALAIAAHARAAYHYGLHGPADHAVRHAIAAGEADLLAKLLVERGPALISTGLEALVADALRALPEDASETQPALLGVTALLLRSLGDREQAVRVATLAARAARRTRADLAAATGEAASPTASQAAVLADSALLNAWLARLGWHDLRDAIADGRSVLGEGEGSSPPLARDFSDASDAMEPARLSWLLHELAVVETWAGDLAAAARHSDQAVLTAQAVGNLRLSAGGLADRSVLQLLDGQFQTAAATARDCLTAAAAGGRLDDGYLGRPYLALGWAAFYDLRFPDAAAALAEVRKIEHHAVDPLVAALGLVLDARLAAERGHVLDARRMLATTPPQPEPAPDFLTGIYAVARAHWALVDGDIGEAAAQIPAMAAIGWQVSASALSAVIADLGGEAAAALAQLEQTLRLPAHGEQVACSVFAAAYAARLHLQAGRMEAARETLREALARAAPQRLLHPLLPAGEVGPAYLDLLTELAGEPGRYPFAPYAEQAIRRYRHRYPGMSSHRSAAGAEPKPESHRRSADGRTVLAARPGVPLGPVSPASATPAFLPPQPLTGREAEVLHELALGGSYRDVAGVLFVTENTVKTHVSALYRKLGVDRRADALRRARALGLI